MNPPQVSLKRKNHLRTLTKAQGGKALAAWITDGAESEGCEDSPSGRENYIRELLQIMEVDIYGPCMNNSMWPVHEDTQRKPLFCLQYLGVASF